ncbi:hypothetical protein KY319_01790 [Candidatus Woesearchaeota archaeon]|nr:hypothetical protein [Candidatus Woesearchaeota archaeon]
MKTHHLANIILILVLITAIAGMYYLFKGTGKATAMIDIETPGTCCCKGETGVFQKTTMKPASQLLLTDCTIICSESSTQKHPVTSLGPC